MKSPDQLFGQLFIDLHLSGIWHDGKVISDATPLFGVDKIMSAYENKKDKVDFDLKDFFENNFEYFSVPTQDFESDKSMSVSDHISRLWSHLSRSSDKEVPGSSLIPLPNAYVVPGGRFNEIYYWDSYFTMLGLEVSHKLEMVESMVDNFSWQINKFGFVPNGNRSYFLGRSQPPFFSLMVALLAKHRGEEIYVKYSDSLIEEYNFWMSNDKDTLETVGCSQHVVNCDGVKLNRYYDKFDSARQEMYGDDVKLANYTTRNANEIYSNLRSACESGWDFSSRWLDTNLKLSTIHALDVLPIDLNCLLYHLEYQIAETYKITGNISESEKFLNLSEIRKKLINDLFWNTEKQFYFDYNHKEKSQTSVESLAAVFPLFFRLANDVQAKYVANKIENHFLMPGGVLTTTIESGQQWDAPNGWAPLQYMTVKALENYGFHKLANEIKSRWLSLNERVFKNTGKMLEKYNVVDVNLLSGGGEYPVQDGFGWTNGVYLSFLNTL